MVSHFEMEGPMRYKQLRNYANRRNTHVRRVRHLRDRFNPLEEYDDEAFRLRFRLRKDSVSDLVKILAKDLEHQTRRGLLLTPMQQVLIALRFYATGTFQRVIGDLFGVSVFAACRVIHKVSRAIAKQKRQFLSIPGNLTDVKRKFSTRGIYNLPSAVKKVFAGMSRSTKFGLHPDSSRGMLFSCSLGI